MNSGWDHDHASDERNGSSDADAAPAVPHVVDDDELLTCWWRGLLKDRQRLRITEHVVTCSYCADGLKELVADGVLELSEACPGGRPATELRPTPVGTRQPLRIRRWATWAMAVSLLACVGGLYYFRPAAPQVALERAREDLERGDYQAAYSGLGRLLLRPLSPSLRNEAGTLFEQSAYHLARNKLRQGAIGDVREICAHVAAAHGGSPRLLNLKLQIERGFVEEYALASAGLLTRYGYQIDGFAGIKPLPTEDLATERQRESLRQAVTQYPDCVELRINYGQLLLEQSRKVEAREQFQAARRLAPENVWALLGLGLTEFDLGQPAAALEHFQELLRLAPEMVAAHVDAAAAAQQAGQPKLAEQYWRSALDAIATQPPSEQDARLRQEIERQLARDRGPERMGWNEPK